MRLVFQGIFIGLMILRTMAPAHALGYLGGPGRNDAMGVTGSTPYITITSAAVQNFTAGDAATAMGAITITQVFSSADGITAAKGLRVKVPASLWMSWDPSVTTATVTGGASGKVSTTVSYANSNKTLVIAVTSDFADGDTITLSGLKFNNFTSVSWCQYLQVEVDNAGTTADIDLYEKDIIDPERATGFLGGSGRMDTEADINTQVHNALMFGADF